MRPAPRPNPQRRRYLKKHFKHNKLRAFRIDAPSFLRQTEQDYSEQSLNARRKIVWGDLYTFIGKRWITSGEFERNLLQNELAKRTQWQQFYDGFVYRNHVTSKGFERFAKTATPVLRAGIALYNQTIKKDKSPVLARLKDLLNRALQAIETEKSTSKEGRAPQITGTTIWTVFGAHNIVLKKQFGEEFTSQLAEAERFTTEWLSRQR